MLFTSQAFILAFLPAVLLLYLKSLRLLGLRAALGTLTLSSFFFYGWWNPIYLWLIGFSILANYALGRCLVEATSQLRKKHLLVFAITLNLGLLGYFKYSEFLVGNFAALLGQQWAIDTIVLPLAISFFTFQQIAYIVDAYRDSRYSYRFSDYVLFVTFFPQLIAGPIVRHNSLIPQFAKPYADEPNAPWIARGLTLFIIGLFKKVVLSDAFEAIANPYYDGTLAGAVSSFAGSWEAALAFTLQIYFDFSAYSDMAIGLALMFGFILPINFDIPYSAMDIQEFWRRWHISLSNFLRDYLYIPLGGSRHGLLTQMFALMITMFLGGLWHGASWSFVVWGLLHGLALATHAGWVKLGLRLPNALAWVLLFLFLSFTWVLFRVSDISVAANIMLSMVDVGSASSSELKEAKWPLLLLGLLIAVVGPSSTTVATELLSAKRRYAVVLGFLLIYLVVQGGYEAKEFIYFQF